MRLFAIIGAIFLFVLPRVAFGQDESPNVLEGVSTGFPQNNVLTEISGMVASRKNPGVLWVHNDSGDGSRIYAMSTDGKHLGTYELSGASAVDYEDIALGPGPKRGVDYLYLGDIGDNLRARSSMVVYRVPEPSVIVNQSPVTETLVDVDALNMQYPDSVYDCETLMIDPLTSDLYFVTKDTRSGQDTGTSYFFRSSAPHKTGASHTLVQVGQVDLGIGLFNLATGGDISPDGRTILLRSYGTLRAWPRDCDVSIADAIQKPPWILPLQLELQGECVAVAGDGAGYYTTSEQPGGVQQPIYFYKSPDMAKGDCEKSSLPPWAVVTLLVVGAGGAIALWVVNR